MIPVKRTPEQIAADDALSAAIETVRQAYGQHDANSMMGEYVVVYEDSIMDPEGDVSYAYGTLYRAGHVATVRAVGLLETASFDLKMASRNE
jgi:hypothetical protein